jgi:hypothetical protein
MSSKRKRSDSDKDEFGSKKQKIEWFCCNINGYYDKDNPLVDRGDSYYVKHVE